MAPRREGSCRTAKRVLEADYIVIGGGNARKLKRLPKNARLGNNDFAFSAAFACGDAATRLGAKHYSRGIVIP